MRLAICLIVIISNLAVAQESIKFETAPLQDINVPFRLFKTQNMWNFLLLDTRDGRVWQIQFTIEEGNKPIALYVNEIPLVSDSENKIGRFTLYPTDNMWNFILLDQYDGRVWQCQFVINGDSRWICPINPASGTLREQTNNKPKTNLMDDYPSGDRFSDLVSDLPQNQKKPDIFDLVAEQMKQIEAFEKWIPDEDESKYITGKSSSGISFEFGNQVGDIFALCRDFDKKYSANYRREALWRTKKAFIQEKIADKDYETKKEWILNRLEAEYIKLNKQPE